MKTKLMLAAAVIVAATAVVSAQYSYKGAWQSGTEYKGDFANFRGDTVKHGQYLGNDLYWWAKFAAAKTDEPGKPGESGGTSPWVLINSLSASKNNGKPNVVWKGKGDGSATNPPVATWRYGAKGAYSMTHDDYGSLGWEKSIKPAYDLAKDYPEIKQSWNIIVGQTEGEEWNNAIKMLEDGHEIFNHSWTHTSAADQYLWFYDGQEIPDFDPSVPYALRGLKVVGAWKQVATTFDEATCKSGLDLTLENDLIKVTGKTNWTGQTFESGAAVTVTPNPGTEQITVNGIQFTVKYDVKADITGLPEDGSAEGITNVGTIAAKDVGWYDLNALKNYGNASKGWTPNTKLNNAEGQFWWAVNPADIAPGCEMVDWSAGGEDPTFACLGQWPCPYKRPCEADQGAPGLMLKVFTVKAWGSDNDFKVNMKDANDKINQMVYNNVEIPGKHFAVGKRSEYFAYPFDAYSLETNEKLKENGIPFGRGGSKIRKVMNADFFYPYGIDFDAFYITKTDWDVDKKDGAANADGNWVVNDAVWTYPENPHVWFGVDELVDAIVAAKGYMIREFHPVVDIADGAWHDSDSPEAWPLNLPKKEQGGSWGGITKLQLGRHYDYIQRTYIANGDLVVFTPSEAIKYRLTANATTGATMTGSASEYTLTATTGSMPAGYEDRTEEISFIIKIDPSVTEMNVEYTTPKTVKAANGNDVTLTNPRLAPKNLGGGEWSVNFDPFICNSVKILPGIPFEDRPWIADEPCSDDPFDPNYDPDCGKTSIAKTKNLKNSIAFTGIRNGQVNLRLTAGNYNVSLYNLQGRVVGSANISAVNGVNATGLKTTGLAKGMLILRVKDAKGASVLQNKIMIK